jgi:uncharacterized protein (DUF1015 family)
MVVHSSPEPDSPATATGLEVRPFRALTYRQQDSGHLARVSSPAYDLVTAEGRERLAAADPHNIVRLILPLVELDADRREEVASRSAAQAAATLHAWQQDGVLDRDPEPALWLYEMAVRDGPSTVGWLGAVALPPAGSSAVLPHEDTYPVAVEGRRALLAATGTDLEPIVLAHDPEPEVARLTAAGRHGPPTLEAVDPDGVSHRLWRVTDPALLTGVTEALRRTGAVIADGHHRFAAARDHAATRAEQPASDAAVLALVTPMGPGGLRVAPIHRVVPDLDFQTASTAAASGFTVSAVPLAGSGTDAVCTAVRQWLEAPRADGFLLTDGHRLARLFDPTPAVLASVPPEAPPAWRKLDVVLAHHGLLAGLLNRSDDPESLVIAHGVDEAVRTAVERSGVALLLRAPSPADVAAVARAGARMPRKSTLFVPKPRTGLVLRPLAD